MPDMQRIVVLDFETTGLDVSEGAVIEMAACRYSLRGGQVQAEPSQTLETLVQPRVPIEPDSLAIHGITDEQAERDGQPPREAFRKLRDFMGDDSLLAHNGVFFDYLYLAAELSRYGLESSDNRLLDTLPLARVHLKSRGYGLATLCETFGIVNEHAHRALSDVGVTTELFRLILEREPDLERLWQQSYGYTMKTLHEAPPGFELLQRAIDERKKLRIEYAGAGKPQRERWIQPRRFQITQKGKRSVRAVCLESNTEKHFRLDRIVKLIALG